MGLYIGKEELMEALRIACLGKAPGPDSFSIEFYKEFKVLRWGILLYNGLDNV